MVSDEERRAQAALAKKRALDTLLERYFRHGAAGYPGGNAQFEKDYHRAYWDKDADIDAKERARNTLFSFSHRLRPSLPGDPGGNKPNQPGSSQEASMANQLDPFAKAQGIAELLKEKNVFSPTKLTKEGVLKQRQMVSSLPGLGPVDYDKQTQESEDLAKLQIALSLMQRGFAAAGATPVRGESAASTLSRELLSPIAGDITPIASGLLKQRREVAAAKRADEARLSQAALTMTQQRLGQEDAARDQRFALSRSLVQRDYTPTKDLQRTVDGKTSDFLGFITVDKLTNLPKYVSIKNDGTLEEVPSEQLSEYRKPATAIKATGATREPRVILVPESDGEGGSRLVKRDVMQAVQLIPDTTTGPQTQYSPQLYWKGSDQRFVAIQNGKYVNPISGTHYFPTDVANYKEPKTQRLYVRDDLTQNQVIKAKSILGKNIEMGEGVNQHSLVHELDPTRSLSMFDVKGRTVNITQAQADELLTVNKPDIEEPFPARGKPFGTTAKELTVTTKDNKQKTIQAVLMQTSPGVFRWKETGADGKFLEDKYQKQAWGTLSDDKLYQSLRPVLDDAYKSAARLRTDLEPEVRTNLQKQVLTQADLKRLAPLQPDERTDALNSIINARARKLTGRKPEEVVSVPSDVLQLDPRVNSMVTVPEGSASSTRSVVNPRIFQPWTRGGEKIQLGTGSHPGFSLPVSSGDVLNSRRNFPAIKEAFEQVYGGTRNLGDAEEKILLFSGLWKNLPGVAEGQGAITLDDNKFRTTFEKATAKYNEAAKVFKPAAALNIGKGAQAKNLQTALEDDTDALRDNMIMLRFKDQGGAWFSDGTWLAELRGSGLGELVESWTGNDGTARKETYAAMPSNKWADIAKPDNQLNAADLDLKKRVFKFLKEKSAAQNQKGQGIGLTEFERAAEYLGALSRYKIRAFNMIQDSRPSDKDIEILLAAFVGNRDSDTTTFAKLHELQNRHVNGLNRRINQGISLNAVFDPVFLTDLDHTSRALQRSSVRDVDPRQGSRARESAALFRRSSDTIQRAVESASGRIIPGSRGGAISPMSGNVDEESTANLYRRVLSSAREAYPNKSDQDAVEEFVRQGLHLKGFLGVFGTRRPATPPVVLESDGSFTLK